MRLFSGKFDDEIVSKIAASQAELSGYVQSLMPGDPSAADVVQRTNIVVWKKRSGFLAGTNFRAWMFAIARLEVRSHHKDCKRKSWLVIDDELTQRISDTMTDAAEAQPIDELRIALESCLKKLKPDERELIDHRYYSDTPLREYALNQGRSLGAIKVTLFRIRMTLKRCIENTQPNPSS